MQGVRHGFRPLVAGLVMACAALAASAQTHGDHSGHGGQAGQAKAKTSELGTGAAFDRDGKLWIAYKDGPHVAVRSSRDYGRSFSEARHVNATPEPVAADHESRPKVATGRDGEIYITWTQPLPKPWTGFIRFARSTDGGQTFAEPLTVHANRDQIAHRFDALAVDPAGRVFVSWIDKRDVAAAEARRQPYAGAAIYYAVSADHGKTFRGDYKIADQSCECCRIALTPTPDGKMLALWRHVFPPDARDHALALLGADGKATPMQRATFDDWRIDACPHHGPGASVAPDGTVHMVWFSVRAGKPTVSVGRWRDGKLQAQRPLDDARAQHADIVALNDNDIAVVWKSFDGQQTRLSAMLSKDGGKTWQTRKLAGTGRDSDQPHLLQHAGRAYVLWRTEAEGFQVFALGEEGA
ncbi:sialidase family protein [Cupriavidus taiwanensis]|uniref:sialidase family protein n=1 Tax=Cupriavidus taiwanensis TaxID=164546 RepID=UPI000E2F670F